MMLICFSSEEYSLYAYYTIVKHKEYPPPTIKYVKYYECFVVHRTPIGNFCVTLPIWKSSASETIKPPPIVIPLIIIS